MQSIAAVRHGAINELEPRPPLNELGIVQAHMAADICARQGIEVIYTSSYRRALQTTAIMANTCGVKVIPHEDLRERDWGEWNNLPWAELQPKLDTLPDRYASPPPGGESHYDVVSRVMGVVADIQGSQYDRPAIVAHNAIVKTVVGEFLEEPPGVYLDRKVGYGEVKVIELNGEAWRLALEAKPIQ